jgi:hypothetical protein
MTGLVRTSSCLWTNASLVGASKLFRCPKSFLLPNDYEIAYVVNMVAPLYATAGRRPEFSNAEVSP